MGKTAVAIDLTQSGGASEHGVAAQDRAGAGPSGRGSFCTRQKARRTRTSACGWRCAQHRRKMAAAGRRASVAGLYDEPRPGAPRGSATTTSPRSFARPLETTPRDATHSNLRSMAKAAGFAPLDLEFIGSGRPSIFSPHHAHRNVQAFRRPLSLSRRCAILSACIPSPPERALILCVDD